MTILIPNPTPSPAFDSPKKETPQLAQVAATLLPGLHHARSLVDVSIQVLTAFANPPALPLSEAQIAAKVRRLLITAPTT